MNKELFLELDHDSDDILKLQQAEENIMKAITKHNRNTKHRSTLQLWSKIDIKETNKLIIRIYKLWN